MICHLKVVICQDASDEAVIRELDFICARGEKLDLTSPDGRSIPIRLQGNVPYINANCTPATLPDTPRHGGNKRQKHTRKPKKTKRRSALPATYKGTKLPPLWDSSDSEDEGPTGRLLAAMSSDESGNESDDSAPAPLAALLAEAPAEPPPEPPVVPPDAPPRPRRKRGPRIANKVPTGQDTLPEGHSLTHFPKHSKCDFCMKCKLTNAACKNKQQPHDESADPIQKYGDLMTGAHIVLGNGTEFSRVNDTSLLVVQDSYTKWSEALPAKCRTAEETYSLLKSLPAPVKELEWPHSFSTHRSETNGVGERANRRTIEGTATTLMASGLGHSWWPEAVKCYAQLRNVHDIVKDSQTPYMRRHHKEFNYHFQPGGHWSGDYYVLDALDWSASSHRHALHLHRIKEIIVPDKECFPIREGLFEGTVSLPEEPLQLTNDDNANDDQPPIADAINDHNAHDAPAAIEDESSSST